MADSFSRTMSPGQDNASEELSFHTPRSTVTADRERANNVEVLTLVRRPSAAGYSAAGTGAGTGAASSSMDSPIFGNSADAGNSVNAGNANSHGNTGNASHRNQHNFRNPANAGNAPIHGNAVNHNQQNFHNNGNRQQAQNSNNVPTMNDLYNLLQQSLQPRRPVHPQILHHDLEYVVPNRGSQINISRDCPETLSDRRLWLKTVEVLFENSQSGIRWIERNSILACKESTQAPNIYTSNFNFDIVIPLSHIFRIVDGHLFLEQPDTDGHNLYIQIADRVIHEISRKVYALLLSRIPESSQHLIESVKSYDGVALIKCLRSQTDNIHQTLVESLRDRKSALSLSSLADWPKTKSDFVSLYKDWQQAVVDGAIDVGDSLTENSFKHLVADVCDTELPGTYEWVHNLDNRSKSWRDCLDHCDMLCRAQAKRLISRRQSESTGLLAADCDFSGESSDDAAAHSHYNYQRRYTPPPRERQRQPHAGRGAGIVRDTWRGGWSGYVKGKGSARGRGRGKGRPYSYSSSQRNGHASQQSKGKRPKTGKLMTFDEWMEAFRSFQENQSSHTHATIASHNTSPNDTHAMSPADTTLGDTHAHTHDVSIDDESDHGNVADDDEARFQ